MLNRYDKKHFLQKVDTLKHQAEHAGVEKDVLEEIDDLKIYVDRVRPADWRFRRGHNLARRNLEHLSNKVNAIVSHNNKQNREFARSWVLLCMFMSFGVATQYIFQKGNLHPGILPEPVSSVDWEIAIFGTIMALTCGFIPSLLVTLYFRFISHPIDRVLVQNRFPIDRYERRHELPKSESIATLFALFKAIIISLGAFAVMFTALGIPFLSAFFSLNYVYPFLFPFLVTLLTAGIPTTKNLIPTIFIGINNFASIVTIFLAVVGLYKFIKKSLVKGNESK